MLKRSSDTRNSQPPSKSTLCLFPRISGRRSKLWREWLPMVTNGNRARKDCRKRLSRFNKINRRHEETRTPDLYRVKVPFNGN